MRERQVSENLKPAVKVKYSFINILSSSALSNRRIPYMIVQSLKPGPLIWLTGCMHGDEIGGTVIIHEIFKKLRTKLLRGSVYALPLMNPIGFETVSRNITLSKEDLNRSFPGAPNGTLAERIAHKILSLITSTQPDLVLDLHNDWNRSIPYALLDYVHYTRSPPAYQRIKLFGERTGLVVINDTEEIQSSLTYNLLARDIIALTLELGESMVINENDISHGVSAVWNLFKALNMVDDAEPFYQYTLPRPIRDKTLNYSYRPLSSKSGIIRFLKKPGQLIRNGDPIARVYNAFGKRIDTIHALDRGIILGHSDYAITYPGASVMAFGIY